MARISGLIATHEKGTMPSLAKADAILTALGRSMTIGDDTKKTTATKKVAVEWTFMY